MDVIFEIVFEIFGEVIFALFGHTGKAMMNPEYSRAKRILNFLLFTLPVSGILILIGVLVYDTTDSVRVIISLALFAFAAILFICLGIISWIGRKPKERNAAKNAKASVGFIAAYKNTVMDKNAPQKTRIALITLPMIPLYIICIFIGVASGSFSLAVLLLICVVLNILLVRYFLKGKK